MNDLSFQKTAPETCRTQEPVISMEYDPSVRSPYHDMIISNNNNNNKGTNNHEKNTVSPDRVER